MTSFTSAIILLLGIAIGAVATWMLSRGQAKSELNAALAQAQLAAGAEVAAAGVRIQEGERERQQLLASLTDGKSLERQLVGDLSKSKSENAQLAERASRVPAIEKEVAGLRELLATANENLGRVRETSSQATAKLSSELLAARENLEAANGHLQSLEELRGSLEAENRQMKAELAALQERFEAAQRNVDEKLQLLASAREELSNQFKALASDILEEKSKRFAEQNQSNLGQLLDPLRTKIVEFQTKVEQVYVNESKDRSAMAQQVRQLADLNQLLSEQAQNLTAALRGSSKTQGGWGEYILERVLEATGLRKGHEFEAQEAQVTADGRRLLPDVVINLPEDRRLVVDSKVSLVAYERFVVAEDEIERREALKEHLSSVRRHVKHLSEKNYHALYGHRSIDFVLMFVPIEPAFLLAVGEDSELFIDAWQRNVLLVSPSTLLFVVRTVAHLWRQESQSRNAQEVAKRGAELYDRLVSFVDDLKTVGDRLQNAQDAHLSAVKRLSQGRGNVIRQAEMLRDMGVKPSKQIAQVFLDLAEADADNEPLSEPGAPAIAANDGEHVVA